MLSVDKNIAYVEAKIHYILQISVQQYAGTETLQHVVLFAQKNKHQKLKQGTTSSPITAQRYSVKILNITS